MKTARYIGLAVLVLIWGWLAWYILCYSGINLKNIFIVVASAIIIFVPLYKKYFKRGN